MPRKERIFLRTSDVEGNKTPKLVNAVADWLEENCLEQDPSGARTLSHVCVVVSTAQSGRQLRLALARKFPDGIIPPAVVQPMKLVAPKDETYREAGDAELAALFLAFAKERPRRFLKDGRVEEVLEWTHLFGKEALDDSDALLSLFDQLQDIWRILGAAGLLMSDVLENDSAKKVLEEALGDEVERWTELAELETAFFEYLHKYGLRHRTECANLAKTAPVKLPSGIRKVVLPALVDPVPVLFNVLERQGDELDVTVLIYGCEADGDKFDDWGRPKVDRWTSNARPALTLQDDDIIVAASDDKLAKAIANDFPAAKDDKKLPSLGLCDESLFDALSAAFLGKGYELHNPEKYRLLSSSLGRIASRLLLLVASVDPYPWDDFISLMREDDILRYLTRGEGAPWREKILEGIDLFRNKMLPETVATKGTWQLGNFARTSERRAVEDFAKAADKIAGLIGSARENGDFSAVGFLRKALSAIYTERKLSDGPGDREFAAAIDAMNEVLKGFDGDVIKSLGLDAGMQSALLRKLLADAVYSLEPDSAEAMLTEGWLELAWSPNDKIALAGMNEGCVPDTVAGHIFLPEKLREALGLPSNDQRLARDTFLLSSILDARCAGDVRAYYSRTSDKGDIHKPSRLLFLVEDECLAARTGRLFGELPSDETRPPRIVAKGLQPRLPSAVPLRGVSAQEPEGHLSATIIDAWLKCPFSYLLQYGLGMEQVEEKKELGYDDFGTLVHNVLEIYAVEQLERSAAGKEQLSDEFDIRDALERIVDRKISEYGTAIGLNISLQLDAVKRRILSFAPIQAAWTNDGWIIAGKPELKGISRPFAGDGDADVPVKFAVDRVDYKEDVGYRLIDYKTWDEVGKASAHIVKGGADNVSHAEELGLPMTEKGDKIAKDQYAPRRFLTVQLPLYGLCLEKWIVPKDLGFPVPFAGNVKEYCYVVLGKTPKTTGVYGLDDNRRIKLHAHKNKIIETAKIAIRAIRSNIFWPPGPGDKLPNGLGDIILISPEKDLAGSEWLEEQKRRLSAIPWRKNGNSGDAATSMEGMP